MADVLPLHALVADPPADPAGSPLVVGLKTITHNGTTYTCPFIDALPPLTAEERAELKADIEKNGMTYPVLVTETGTIIDGHNRLEIAAELGLATVPMTVLQGLTPDQQEERAEDLNLHRRHLTQEAKRQIIARRLKSNPNLSNRAIANAVKADHKTVGKVRGDLESTGEIPQLTRTQGEDGKTRRSTNTTSKQSPPDTGHNSPAQMDKTPPTKAPSWRSLARAVEIRCDDVLRNMKRRTGTVAEGQSYTEARKLAAVLRSVASLLDEAANDGENQGGRSND